MRCETIDHCYIRGKLILGAAQPVGSHEYEALHITGVSWNVLCSASLAGALYALHDLISLLYSYTYAPSMPQLRYEWAFMTFSSGILIATSSAGRPLAPYLYF